MIVGHKIEQWLEITDGRGHWNVTTHRKVTELHATKGWRVVRRDRSLQRVRNLPSWRDRHAVTQRVFVRTPTSPSRNRENHAQPYRLKGIRS
jgi:hypothetical protein